jgi:signal transduction histidine kinase
VPPTRGHLKLALFFLALASIGAFCASRWMEGARAAGPDGELVRLEDARRIALALVVGCALLGFLGVLVRRMTVASARAREQALWAGKVQAESQKYRALFEGSADMLLIVDPRTLAIREGNAPAREQLGAPAGIEALLEEPQRAPFAEALRRAAGPGGGAQTLSDLGLRASTGRTLVADARLASIAIAGEALVLVSLHDRTQQRALERELALRERLSSIGLFTAGVAHEINNPLEGIGNYLGLLEQDDLPPESRRRYLALVQHGFGRIRDLVRDLLRFARPEYSSARIDLAEVVANASKLVALSAALKQVVIETHGLERPLELFGDAGRLEQVLVNLLLNAGKAQQGQGRITLRARALPAENVLELAVEDNGPGIPPENLGRIFDPFFGSGEGTGLGLAVSYGIVRAHGGTIAAENRPAGGARFVVRLPRNLPEESS